MDATASIPHQELIRRSLEPMAEAIDAFLDAARGPRAGRLHTAAPYLELIDPIEAAYLTARVALGAASASMKLTTAATRVSMAIEDHLNFLKLSKEHPGLYRTIVRKIKTSTSGKHRRMVINRNFDVAQIDRLKWDPEDRVRLGVKLIEIFRDTLGLVELQLTTVRRHRTEQRVTFTPAANEWLAKGHERASLLAPIHLPMVAPPLPWSSPYVGGYLSGSVRAWFVRVSSRTKLADYETIDMPHVYDAVNRIQSTPWRINRAVLAVVKELWTTGGGVAKLPAREPVPIPSKPSWLGEKMDTKKLPLSKQEEFREWKARAAKAHEKNMTARGKLVAMSTKLYIAERFKDEASIYFPAYLDFRSRIYFFADYLNPQGDDVCRGMLEFGVGKPLGLQGIYWLAVNLANTYGEDKLPLRERARWAEENTDRIWQCATNPLDTVEWWGKASKPFQFLAACFEWAGMLAMGERRADYVSHLPIQQDGSCSGLQHFSAMLRDPIGGKAVNLVPGDRPADIYTDVAHAAQKILQSSTDPAAEVWRGTAPGGGHKICRKIAKRPTMTLCYSATRTGRQGQIEDELNKLDAEKGARWLGKTDVENYRAAVFMAGVIEEAMGNVVVAAKEAMRWLKEVSQVCAKANIPICWTTPVGFYAKQAYMQPVGRRIEIGWGGKKLKLTVMREGSKIVTKEQGLGIAPNFVHSMDASHLMATVNLGAENGLEHWSVIHDSFGVHACDVDTMNACIREAFIEQYSTNRLAQFREEVIEQLERLAPELVGEIPPVPEMGTLDVEGVRDSEYFFA